MAYFDTIEKKNIQLNKVLISILSSSLINNRLIKMPCRYNKLNIVHFEKFFGIGESNEYGTD